MILAGGSSTLPYSQLRGPPIGACSVLESLGCVGHVFHPFHPNQVSLGSKKIHEGGNTPQKADFIETFYDTQPPDERFSNCSNFLSRPLLSELRNEWG